MATVTVSTASAARLGHAFIPNIYYRRNRKVSSVSRSSGWHAERRTAAMKEDHVNEWPSGKVQLNWAGAAIASAFVMLSPMMMTPSSLAELNVYEYNAGGEFGTGTAQQYGEADIKGKDFSGQVSPE